jgi:hypothetical protein
LVTESLPLLAIQTFPDMSIAMLVGALVPTV